MAFDPVATAALDPQLAAARAANDFGRIDDLLASTVDAAAAGDRAALDGLLRAIDKHRLAQGAVRKMLIDEGDVSDALQQTLLQVSRAISTFERRSRFTTWLYRIAEREALQVLRRNQRVTRPEGEDLSGLTAEVQRMSSIIASRAMIRQALDELDPKFREPVVLRDVEGLDYAAIAERLDIPLNTVKTRISRGRQYIADKIIEYQRSGGSLA